MELEEDVDFSERAIVDLRDCLIARLRGHVREADVPLRAALDRVNVAVSLIVSVEYPAGGIHRKKIEQALDILQGLLREELSSSQP